MRAISTHYSHCQQGVYRSKLCKTTQNCRLVHNERIKMQIIKLDSINFFKNILSKLECEELISRSEAIGFTDAPVKMGRKGEMMLQHIRNNQRIEYEDSKLAENLFQRISPFLPRKIDGWQMLRLNDHFRFYKYSPNQRYSYFLWLE